jgi:hypothetical protein
MVKKFQKDVREMEITKRQLSADTDSDIHIKNRTYPHQDVVAGLTQYTKVKPNDV